MAQPLLCCSVKSVRQALQDELERSRLELEQAVKEKDSTIAAKDKEISQVRTFCDIPIGEAVNSASTFPALRSCPTYRCHRPSALKLFVTYSNAYERVQGATHSS